MSQFNSYQFSIHRSFCFWGDARVITQMKVAIIKFDWADSGDEMLTQFTVFNSTRTLYPCGQQSLSHRKYLFHWTFILSFRYVSILSIPIQCQSFIYALFSHNVDFLHKLPESFALINERLEANSPPYDNVNVSEWNHLKCCRFFQFSFVLFYHSQSLCLHYLLRSFGLPVRFVLFRFGFFFLFRCT